MNKVEEYIKTAKVYPFSIGDSILLSEVEEHIYFMERYLNGKMTAKELVHHLSSECPDSNFIEYDELCEEPGWDCDNRECCEKCWGRALGL